MPGGIRIHRPRAAAAPGAALSTTRRGWRVANRRRFEDRRRTLADLRRLARIRFRGAALHVAPAHAPSPRGVHTRRSGRADTARLYDDRSRPANVARVAP